MKRLKKIHGSCAVLALKFASGKDESLVIDICKFHGFEWGEGMTDEEWCAAAKDLGIRKRLIKFKKCSLSNFIKDHPIGMFFVGTYNHLFVLNNGGIINHPSEGSMDMRRIVKKAWKII